MCNFHKNQDRTFDKVFFEREGIELFLKKKLVSYDTPCLVHAPSKNAKACKSWKSCKILKLIFLNHLLLHDSLRIDGSNKNVKAKLSSFKNSRW